MQSFKIVRETPYMIQQHPGTQMINKTLCDNEKNKRIFSLMNAIVGREPLPRPPNSHGPTRKEIHQHIASLSQSQKLERIYKLMKRITPDGPYSQGLF